MNAQKLKVARTERRKNRVRKAISGTAQKPRLSVHRTHQHIYAQLIDDTTGMTLASASSNDKGCELAYGGNISAASVVGKLLADKAKTKNITEAAFDRGAFRYHGRVKALARAATEAGLKCTSLEEKVKVAAPAGDAVEKKKKPAKA